VGVKTCMSTWAYRDVESEVGVAEVGDVDLDAPYGHTGNVDDVDVDDVARGNGRGTWTWNVDWNVDVECGNGRGK
jgi:hypothetical protein